MPDPESRTAVVMAWIAATLLVTFSVIGLMWHGVSNETLNRFWTDLVNRPGGPMTFRFVLQPAMAALAALHDGIKDARLGRSPYFWVIVHDPARRTRRLREALISTGRIILLGLAMDAIYQYKEFTTFYPAEAVVIALTLAVVPYFILRGPIARIWRRRLARSASQ